MLRKVKNENTLTSRSSQTTDSQKLKLLPKNYVQRKNKFNYNGVIRYQLYISIQHSHLTLSLIVAVF